MEWLNEILYYELFQIDLTPENGEGPKSITVLKVLITIFILIGSRIVLWTLRKVFDRIVQTRRLLLEKHRRKTVFQIIQVIVYLITFVFVLKALGFGINQFIAFLSSLAEQKLFDLDLNPEDDEDGKPVTVFNVLVIIFIFIGSRVALWSLRKVFDRADQYRRIPMERGRRKAVFQIVQYIVYLITFIIILNSLAFEINQFIALSAALLVGLGFGLQNIFNDIVSGIIILIDGTIEVDDVVEVDTMNLMGKVKSIRLRTSIIETPDAITVVVPNSKFTSTNVINWSHDEKSTRFHIEVGVAYGSNVSLVRNILKDVAAKHGNILTSPEPKVFFKDFGNSALIFDLLFWTEKSFTIEEIKSDLRYMIEAEFRRNKVKIPFPQRDLHIVEDFRFGLHNDKDVQSNTKAQ